MIRIKNLELELDDRSVVKVDTQRRPLSLKQLNDLIIESIFTTKLRENLESGTEYAQWATALEVGMRSTSTIYRAIRRNSSENNPSRERLQERYVKLEEEVCFT